MTCATKSDQDVRKKGGELVEMDGCVDGVLNPTVLMESQSALQFETRLGEIKNSLKTCVNL
jgi:hypothetical protein